MGHPNLMKVIWHSLGYSLASDHSPVNGCLLLMSQGKETHLEKT